MTTVKSIQQLQLRLIEAASVSESCATDLLSVLHKLNCAEARCIIGIIGQLNNEARSLRKLSKDIVHGDSGQMTC